MMTWEVAIVTIPSREHAARDSRRCKECVLGLQKLTPKKAAFLAAFPQVGSIAKAAAIAGVSRQAHYKWHAEDEEYRKTFATAKEEAIDELEYQAHRRAVDGIERLKFDAKGRPFIDPRTGQPYVEHVYSDNLLMFLMKALAPHKYRERSGVNFGDQVELNLTVRMEQLQRIMEDIGRADRSGNSRLKRRTVEGNR